MFIQIIYNTSKLWYMYDAVFCKIVAKYSAVQYEWKLNPALHIIGNSSVERAEGLRSKGCYFDPTVRHYFSFNKVRLLAYMTHDQNDWSVKNQIKYTHLIQGFHLQILPNLKVQITSCVVFDFILKLSELQFHICCVIFQPCWALLIATLAFDF